MTPAMVAVLRESLREVCSLDDVKERMGKYMSTEACEEVLIMMCQICKNIDERRLKMKAHCPIVTDLRLKENATRIFLCYNPEWLRVGLHIVLGGDCLLQSGSWKRDKEVHFLKLLLEKQLFGQNGTGYTETLGNIILKRMFLLVAALDRAKMERTLPLKFGIDSLDGGSPPLFCHRANIKSSQQIIQKSLAEAMHGEGDLLVHLSIMGYKLNYQQLALSEYDFTIGNLFEDLHDGIILCRVVQLLLSDASIILKVIAPSDTHKKKLQNCTTAIQYIKQAGVPISDADGVTISAEDIANGDKELILSLLWNMFIHMQLPLVVNKTSLARELSRLKALAVEQPISVTKSHMGLLYDWIQVVCAKCGLSVESSQIDRRALNYFINHYLNISIHTCPLKKTFSDCRKELFSCHEQTATAISSCPSSKIEDLGDFLQDFPASGILANDVLFDEKGAIILIAFLCSHLTNDKRLEQLRNSISGRLDCQRLENRVSARLRSPGKNDVKYQSPQTEKAATIIQAQIRRIIAKNRYHKLKRSISILQGAIRAWSFVNMTRKSSCLTAASPTHARAYGSYSRYLIFILERHRFVRMRRSTIVIQQAVRIWIGERKRSENIEPFESHEFLETTASPKTDCIEMCDGEHETTPCKDLGILVTSAAPQCLDESNHIDTVTIVQLHVKNSNYVTSPSPHQSIIKSGSVDSVSHQPCEIETDSIASATRLACEADVDCGSNISCGASFQHEHPVSAQLDFSLRKDIMAVQKIQFAYRRFVHNRSSRIYAATKIQSHWRGFTMRMCFTKQVEAITVIQSVARHNLCSWAFQRFHNAALDIQRIARGGFARKRLLGSSLQTYTSLVSLDQSQHKRSHQSTELKIVLYSTLRLQRWWRKVLLHQSIKLSAISIQSSVRGWLARKQVKRITCCVHVIQRWWRNVMFLESRKRAATTIQSHVRGWIARQSAIRKKKSITIIQSFVKAYHVRKASKEEVVYIRSRIQKASAQVDDGMRLINRLIAALSQITGCRSISSIRQTCTTLSIATELSEKCCETLVDAGAVDILLKQIPRLNRGIPDQEVLKQVLYTLRNIARFPNVRPVLANNPQLVNTIFQELLRNKTDMFFIACGILMKLCESEEGRGFAGALRHHIRGLGSMVRGLEKKVELDKRNGRTGARKEDNLRRLGEAAALYHLLTDK
ncbi:abnormal spindle-like microcephaly-associated protein isoform X1 [Hordeum vulgare subsp. vulgare]|nr:abnormal spindle-like microcephaly-associated protein isoform X1 [Hordeum vulgare subsp. vulgare]